MKTITYRIDGLDCANCAAKVEAKLNALPDVARAELVYTTGQLRITAEDPDALLPVLRATATAEEPDVTILSGASAPRAQAHTHNHAHDHEHCHDHDHEHDHDHGDHDHDHSHGDAESPVPILVGAGLFAAGLIAASLGGKWVSAALYIIAYLVLGLPILKKAARGLFRGKVLDENFLMSVASLGAFAIGEFPEAVGVMLFYRVGEYFEDRAVARSRSQIMDAVDLRPETVNRLHDGKTETIPAEDACAGDILLVRPGDRIPLDGTILSGESRLDTSPITGEPVPVHAGVGDAVTSGCVNTSGTLTIRVEKPLAESMVTRILNSVENAAASKPKIDRFITRFSRIYTPIVVGLALLVAVVPPLFTGDWNYWIYTALSFLVMSCPCALVLSVPLAFFSGIGAGSRKGILFKGGLSIEALAGVKAVAMDKTGTLTQGNFAVQEVSGGDALLALCASCEQQSTHPIAVSIVAAAKARGLSLTAPQSLEELSGKGLRAQLGGQTVLCGNAALLAENGVDLASLHPNGIGTLVFVAVDGTAKGYIRISDTLKPEASESLARLKKMGVHTAMFTGDNAESAQAVAQALGIDEVHARLLPADKLSALQSLRENAGSVMFVGDGINDAPVLAGADVGAAMGSGADAAIEAADVVYMTASVSAIPESLAIARRTKAVGWQNVVFALAVKIVVMILGLCGHANMWLAVFADTGVAMLCVLNAVRLLYSRK